MRLAENMKILRMRNIITQEEISEKLNVSRQVVSKWETGKSWPDLDIVVKLAELFNVTLDDLVLGKLEETTTFTNPRERIESDLKKFNPTLEDEENWLFPRAYVGDSVAYEIFKKAYEIDLNVQQTGNRDLIVDALHLYTDAFDGGISEAAVNILRMLILVQMTFKAKSPDEPLPFRDRVEYFTDALIEARHPAGDYYHAIGFIYGTIKNEYSEEDNMNNGLVLMESLSNEGNIYAQRYLDTIEHAV